MPKLIPVLLVLLLGQPTFAAPGPQISQMMQTPASAFDMFLFRIYEAAKCNNVLKNNNADEADLCLSSIKYDIDDNILFAYFRVLPAAEAMDDFTEQDNAGRKATMLALLENTAKRVGALDSWGLIHNIPISFDLNMSNTTIKAFRAELAKRTATTLTTSYDGVVYTATRNHNGTIKYLTNQ